MAKKIRTYKEEVAFQMELLEHAYLKRFETFFDQHCLRPTSWCGGGEIPVMARKFEGCEPIDATPCKYFEGGKCLHPAEPKFMSTAEIMAVAEELCKGMKGAKE